MLQAQQAQETIKEKADIAAKEGGVAITSSADGKYVYVAAPRA